MLIAHQRRPSAILTGIGLAVFGSSFIFAMTGEVDGVDEAERLVKLTRVSRPFAEQETFSQGIVDFEKNSDERFTLSSERREWVQIVDASKYEGRRIRVRARAFFDQEIGLVDLWASVNDMRDRALETESEPISSGTGSREFTLYIDVPKHAAKLRYGLSFRGEGMVLVDQFEFEIVDSDLLGF